MELTAVYAAFGSDRTSGLVQTVSLGALRTFGVYEAVKVRSRLKKLNRQKLRAAAPKMWERIKDGDTDLARDLTQAVLVSNIPLVVEVLDLLEIEHDGNGFFAKDGDYSSQFSNGWEQKVFKHCKDRFDTDLVLLYINHLGWEMDALDKPFLGSGPTKKPAKKAAKRPAKKAAA